MNTQQNISAWLSDAPSEMRQETQALLGKVASLREAGEVIYPPQDRILAALELTGPSDVRVVILGQDPYHGPGQAMGLSFSVPQGQKLPPSLRNIYKELAADLGCPMPASGDLTSWARQGVLLLNTTLTVREHAANSHAKLGWQVLTDYVVERCCKLPQPVVFLAWGRFAANMVQAKLEATGTGPRAHRHVLASTHPSPLSANRASGELPAFMGSAPFSRANELLVDAGATPIDWTSGLR